MAKKEKKTEDFNQIAKSVVDRATSGSKEKKEEASSPKEKPVKR